MSVGDAFSCKAAVLRMEQVHEFNACAPGGAPQQPHGGAVLHAGQALGRLFSGKRPHSLELSVEPIYGVQIDVEICSRSAFKVVPIPIAAAVALQLRERVGREFRLLIRKFAGTETHTAASASHTFGVECKFPLTSYMTILERLRAAPFHKCQLETPPLWIVSAMLKDMQRPAEVHDRCAKQLQAYLCQVPAALREQQPMRAFQEEGVRFALSRDGRCLLADEMGLGKTLQALVTMAHFVEDWPVLVVAPATLRFVWQEQARQWLPHILRSRRDVHVVMSGKQVPGRAAKLIIVSYDLLVKCPALQMRADGQRYRAVIVDESHYIKNSKSERAKAVLSICAAARRCVLVSGTPAVNRPEELYTQLMAVCPDIDGCLGHTQFHDRYCVGPTRHMELNSFLSATLMIRHMKADVLKQLPEKVRQRITLGRNSLDADRLKEVDACLNNDFAHLAEDDDLTGSSLTPAVMRTFKATAEAKVDCVSKYVEYLLSNNLKFLLFAHHHAMLDALERKLSDLSVEHIRIDGCTDQSCRPQLVHRFQSLDSVRVALLSITACGQGLTLTAAHTVVFAELYWVPGQLLQAEDRCHRLGQRQHVDVHYCIAERTLDEHIFRLLNRKHRSTSGVLDGMERGLDVRKAPCKPRQPVPLDDTETIAPAQAASAATKAEAASTLASILAAARKAAPTPASAAATPSACAPSTCESTSELVDSSPNASRSTYGFDFAATLRKRLMESATPQAARARAQHSAIAGAGSASSFPAPPLKRLRRGASAPSADDG